MERGEPEQGAPDGRQEEQKDIGQAIASSGSVAEPSEGPGLKPGSTPQSCRTWGTVSPSDTSFTELL